MLKSAIVIKCFEWRFEKFLKVLNAKIFGIQRFWHFRIMPNITQKRPVKSQNSLRNHVDNMDHRIVINKSSYADFVKIAALLFWLWKRHLCGLEIRIYKSTAFVRGCYCLRLLSAFWFIKQLRFLIVDFHVYKGATKRTSILTWSASL